MRLSTAPSPPKMDLNTSSATATAAWVQSPRFQESRWARMPAPPPPRTAAHVTGRHDGGDGTGGSLWSPRAETSSNQRHQLRTVMPANRTVSVANAKASVGYARTSSFTVSWNPTGSASEFHVPSPLPKGMWKETRMRELQRTSKSRERQRREARQKEYEAQERRRRESEEMRHELEQRKREVRMKKAQLEARLAARRSAGPLLNAAMRRWWARHKLRKAIEEMRAKHAAKVIKGTMRKGRLNKWREANEKRRLNMYASRLQRAWRRRLQRRGLGVVLAGREQLKKYFKWLDDFFAAERRRILDLNATKIQRHARGMNTRKRYIRGQTPGMRLIRRDGLLKKAAIKLQKHWRGKRDRRRAREQAKIPFQRTSQIKTKRSKAVEETLQNEAAHLTFAVSPSIVGGFPPPPPPVQTAHGKPHGSQSSTAGSSRQVSPDLVSQSSLSPSPLGNSAPSHAGGPHEGARARSNSKEEARSQNSRQNHAGAGGKRRPAAGCSDSMRASPTGLSSPTANRPSPPSSKDGASKGFKRRNKP